MNIVAPVSGLLTPLTQVPDPVFATGMLGPGVAITPNPGQVDVVAPIAGTVSALKPHAFIVKSDAGPAALVHLGIDTVGNTDLFEIEPSLVEGAHVSAGHKIMSWDVAATHDLGLPTHVAVVVLDAPGITPNLVEETGSAVEAAQTILELRPTDRKSVV